ncbi:Sorting assembly machinery subunit [Candida viswanathii]|uniref:Sorting assembly machinery subunit n=1 Tax=Candida viswanathii TaxID=5486 RepID=A0A367YPU1_9ASCO|nr:Sorting assembly machinery subunit [Candida viswanathii]
MILLHVWGKDDEISIISPASIAASWILHLVLAPQSAPFEIVTSNNTNLSSINELPVLVVNEDEKYSGLDEIVSYIEDKYQSSKYASSKSMSTQQQLLNRGLLNLLTSKIQYINQYNLYSNTKNYEKFTRKLFATYFPFPMMYNQPLKFHNQAQEQIKLLGLSKNQVSFFSFIGGGGGGEDQEVAQTEIFNDEISDDDDEQDQVAISSLHEKQLLKKSKTKQVLQESKNSMRCLILINHYINEFVKLYAKNGGDQKFGYIFGDAPSSSELLFYAYIVCLTSEKLPDRFIYNYLLLKQPDALKFIDETTKNYKLDTFRDPVGVEIPNLFNEIGYWVGSIRY